jgi:hypothetical protein
MVHANVPCNRVKPWQHWLAPTIGIPHFVNAKPRFLQQIVCFTSTGELHRKKPMQLWAEAIDEDSGSGEIPRLIAGHQGFQMAV